MTASHNDDGVEQKRAGTAMPNWIDGRWRSWLDVLAFLAVGWAFWVAAGVPGAVVTALLVVGWLVLPNVAVFVAGVIALAALVPPDTSLATGALPVGALVVLLVTTTVTDSRLRDGVAVLVVLVALLAVGASVYSFTGSLWPALAAVVLGSTAGFVSLDLTALSRFGTITDE